MADDGRPGLRDEQASSAVHTYQWMRREGLLIGVVCVAGRLLVKLLTQMIRNYLNKSDTNLFVMKPTISFSFKSNYFFEILLVNETF